MKLGQVLSTRPDLMPPGYEAQLALLQDAAPVLPASVVTAAIEQTFGRPIVELFDQFNAAPLAAASIGQVHAATLRDGRDVVVKVQRPGVVDRVAVDLELIAGIARVLGRFDVVARYDPVGLAGEFAVTMGGELDYEREAQNATRIAENFATVSSVRIPDIVSDLTCDVVITEERIRGIKVDDVEALNAAGVDQVKLARCFVDAYLSMVFQHRFFHADPHPGNIFVDADGRVAFVDFGMVGTIDDTTGAQLGTILLALVAKDAGAMADGLLSMGVASEHVERTTFERDLAHLLERYGHVPLEQLHLRVLLVDLMSVVRAHRLRLPSAIALLLKTVMMCEGVAAQLDPAFELVPLLIPYAAALVPGGATA